MLRVIEVCRCRRLVLAAPIAAAAFIGGCVSFDDGREGSHPDAGVAAAAAAPPTVMEPITTPARAPAADPPPPVAPPGLWGRLAVNAELVDCERLSPRSQRWRDQYTRQARALEADIERALPLIELAAGELERRRVPTLFAMLPMVESQFYAPAVTGNRPAGIWQLMPQTARGLGVRVAADYDGRLDHLRATEAAAELLAHLGSQFDGDWRYVNMAFNAGEFRVKKALRRRAKDASIDDLGLSKITLHHLAKLEALTCLIAAPTAHGLVLPDPAKADTLLPLAIEAPIATAFVAHLADIDMRTLRRWNPALRGEYTPSVPGLRLLLPAMVSGHVADALARLPPDQWQRWRPLAPASASERSLLLERFSGDAAMVRTMNPDPMNSASLWLPIGNAPGAIDTAVAAADPPTSVHVIRSGDTLWEIAKRYGVALKRLMRWNRLDAGSVLRPGQRIRLTAP